MNVSNAPGSRQKLTTPRSAAVAGILFALLYGISLVIVRLSIPVTLDRVDSTLLATNARMLTLALNLVPYAGIAFLWFMGVIRDRIGDLEDRFFATVWLASGFLFLAMTFVGAAVAGALLTSYSIASQIPLEDDSLVFGRAVMYHVINIYAIRMAGVFMVSLGTIWLRTGLMHRGWAFLTFALAVLVLVTISFSLWVTLVFPGWVLAVSIYYLVRTRTTAPTG